MGATRTGHGTVSRLNGSGGTETLGLGAPLLFQIPKLSGAGIRF